MKEVKTWIPMAEKNEANYTGLVSSHNWKWCELFKKEKKTVSLTGDQFMKWIDAGDMAATERVIAAMNTMVKMDIAGLEAAYNQP